MKTVALLKIAVALVKRYGYDKELTALDFDIKDIKIPQEMVYNDIEWIITEGNDPMLFGNGELGFRIGSQVFLYYKDHVPMPTQAKWRPVHKREFGEIITKFK